MDQAVSALLTARTSGRPLPCLPDAHIPRDAAQAYAIQDAIAARLGAVGGWKVGAKSPTAEPTCAPLPASLVYATPRAFHLPARALRGIEAEIAVRLKSDLPPRAHAYTREEVAAAIESVHPAIEVVLSRFEDFSRQDPLSLLADSLSNGALVVGPARPGPVVVDQMRQRALVHFDDALVADTVGGNPAQDILRLLTWLANHVAPRCGGLKAGQFITTGSCTGMLFAAPGARVRASMPELGDVEVTFSEMN